MMDKQTKITKSFYKKNYPLLLTTWRSLTPFQTSFFLSFCCLTNYLLITEQSIGRYPPTHQNRNQSQKPPKHKPGLRHH